MTLHVAKDTLHAYLGYLEDAFLVRTVFIAAGSERRRMVNPRKSYPIDPGLIPVFDAAGRANLGHALETCVMLELERRGAEVAYVRTASGQEVDFLVRYPAGTQELIQVCADLTARQTCECEMNVLLEAADEHPKASLHLITLEMPVGAEAPPPMTVHAAGDWLLAEGSSGGGQ